MLQQEQFIKRLKEILDKKQLSSSSFADSIAVPRSSISHLLSGRNKPSLDFVMKIVDSYPDIDINWLLFGKASKVVESPIEKDSYSPMGGNDSNQQQSIPVNPTSSVEKIVVFYKNGVFKEYKPS